MGASLRSLEVGLDGRRPKGERAWLKHLLRIFGNESTKCTRGPVDMVIRMHSSIGHLMHQCSAGFSDSSEMLS